MGRNRARIACMGLLMGVSLGGMSGCARDSVARPDSSGTRVSQDSSQQSGQEKTMCADGYRVTIVENTIFSPGKYREDPSYTVMGVKIENGIMSATIQGGNTESGIMRTLVSGESVTHEGVGTFTLESVSPRGGFLGGATSSATAVFCFVPAPGFAVDPDL